VTRTKRILLATGVALALAVPMGGSLVEAAPATTETSTTITVSGGDSLAGIAYRYGVRLSALLQANSMTVTTVIHPGDTLIIPAGASIPAASNVVSSTGGGSSATSSTYTVVAGDALAGVASRHGVRLSALLQANSMTATSVIHPGDTLIIPAGASIPGSSAGGGSPATTTTTSTTTYTVVAGDALAGIAWRNGVTLGALVKANGISVTSLILPGQTLTIPPATREIPTSRRSTASSTAPAAAAAPETPPSSTTGSLDTLLTYLRAQVGTPYQFFSAGPDTFDCSGLVVAGFRQIGMSMPHQSRALARLGTSVDWTTESIAPGDLVFTSAVNDPAMITHVGVALDSQRWVHAVGLGRTVTIGSLPASDRIMAVQRITLP
jgi:peptidoglycan DL-endopeptidase LytE